MQVKKTLIDLIGDVCDLDEDGDGIANIDDGSPTLLFGIQLK